MVLPLAVHEDGAAVLARRLLVPVMRAGGTSGVAWRATKRATSRVAREGLRTRCGETLAEETTEDTKEERGELGWETHSDPVVVSRLSRVTRPNSRTPVSSGMHVNLPTCMHMGHGVDACVSSCAEAEAHAQRGGEHDLIC